MADEFPNVYTDDYLDKMQTRIEWMHKHWENKTFVKRPSGFGGRTFHKAELEHVLLISPPPGVPSVGWVPVSIEEVYDESLHPNIETGYLKGKF